jgi:hypothetical protein
MKYSIKVTPNSPEFHPHSELNNTAATYKETLETLDFFGFAPNYNLTGTYGEETDTHTVVIDDSTPTIIEEAGEVKPKVKKVRAKK